MGVVAQYTLNNAKCSLAPGVLFLERGAWLFCLAYGAWCFLFLSRAPGVFCSRVWRLVFFVLEYGVCVFLFSGMASGVLVSRVWRLVF